MSDSEYRKTAKELAKKIHEQRIKNDTDYSEAELSEIRQRFYEKHISKAQRGHDELNAQHFKQKADSEFTTFASVANNKPLEPWQKRFLELAIRIKNGGEPLAMPSRPRGKVIGKLYVEITTFEIIRNLAQAELKAAFLLRSKVTSKYGGGMILPAVNHYLDRSLLFYDLSAQTKKASQALKAYKRAKLVCTAIKYLINSERQNHQPSPRVIAVIRGEVRL